MCVFCSSGAQVRVIERSTEGLHSIVKRTLARAPAASLSYLSLDLRFSQLVHTAIVEPRLFQHAIENLYKSLSSLSGFRTAVVAILGLRQANLHICNLKERQLADLLYRDDLSLKHSTAGQIRMAVDNLLQKNAAEADSGESGKRKAEALSAALVEFLVEALGLGPHIITCPWPMGHGILIRSKPILIEGSLEVKLPTIWTVEKQR